MLWRNAWKGKPFKNRAGSEEQSLAGVGPLSQFKLCRRDMECFHSLCFLVTLSTNVIARQREETFNLTFVIVEDNKDLHLVFQLFMNTIRDLKSLKVQVLFLDKDVVLMTDGQVTQFFYRKTAKVCSMTFLNKISEDLKPGVIVFDWLWF